MMTASAFNKAALSGFTLNLLLDSGWYDYNRIYSKGTMLKLNQLNLYSGVKIEDMNSLLNNVMPLKNLENFAMLMNLNVLSITKLMVHAQTFS